MRALIFIQNLKQTLIELDEVSQRHFMFQISNYEIEQKAKSHALKELSKIEDINEYYISQFSQNLLNRENFKKRLRYCYIKLNEFEIPDKERLPYIIEAIDYAIHYDRKNGSIIHSRKRGQKVSIKEMFTEELANCFQPWYYPEDIFRIEFAFERQLININPASRSWNISNIGNYFLKTSVFEAIAFLCSLEIILTSDNYNSKFISRDVLNYLLEPEKKSRFNHRISRIRPHTLKLFGLISDKSYPRNDEIKLTDFGNKILRYVKSNLDNFKEVILFLMEAETVGFKYNNLQNTTEFSNFIDSSNLLDSKIKTQIKNALKQYNEENYIEALRIIYPILEGVLNLGMIKINLKPTDYKGMMGKVEKLEKEGILSYKVSSGLEVFASRNKVLHGNMIDSDEETGRPLLVRPPIFRTKLQKVRKKSLLPVILPCDRTTDGDLYTAG